MVPIITACTVAIAAWLLLWTPAATIVRASKERLTRSQALVAGARYLVAVVLTRIVVADPGTVMAVIWLAAAALSAVAVWLVSARWHALSAAVPAGPWYRRPTTTVALHGIATLALIALAIAPLAIA